VARFQFEPGKLRHQVQFRWPDVTVRAAEQPGLLPGAEPEVVRDDVLVQDVVGVQGDVAGLGVEDDGLLSRRQLAQLRYLQLDDEPAA
jgi:hypothetical protein